MPDVIAPAGCRVEVVETADGVDVRVAGEVDVLFAEHRASLVQQCHRPRVGLDLSEVSFLDSTGLESLQAVAGAVRAGGAHLTVTGMSSPVRRVLDLLGVDEQLTGTGAT